MYYFFRNISNKVFPILRSNPCLEVGIPVSLAIFCLIFVMPNALFQENDTPGIFVSITLVHILFVSCNKCIYLGNNFLNFSIVPIGILILFKFLHQKNTLLPIDVTEFGIEIHFKLSHL